MNRKGAEIAVWKSEKEVEAIKHKYPKGTKLELDFMDEEGMLAFIFHPLRICRRLS